MVSEAFLAFAASDCNGWARLWGLAQGREWRRTKVSGWSVVNGETSRSGSILHTSDGSATWTTQLSGETLALLWTISIANPPLHPLLSIFPLNATNGVLVIELTAPNNHVYELQAASDCLSTNWQPIWVATNLTGKVKKRRPAV
jgi:hypothetical protein